MIAGATNITNDAVDRKKSGLLRWGAGRATRRPLQY